MKLKTTLIFISAILLLAAVNPSGSLKGKLKSTHMNQWGDTLTYEYDKEGRVSSLTTNRGFKTIYEYKGNIIVAKTTGGSLVTMFLNNRGLVDSLVDVDTNRTTIYDSNGNQEQINFGLGRYFPYSGHYVLPLMEIAGVTTHGIQVISKKFIYDNEGFVKEMRAYSMKYQPIIAANIVENGNVVSYSVKFPIDTIYRINPKTMKGDTMIMTQADFTVKNTFDPGKINSLASDVFFGKSCKNIMLRSVKYVHLPGLPLDSNVTTFKYTFDKENRVTTLITTVKTNDPPEEKLYSERPDSCSFTYY